MSDLVFSIVVATLDRAQTLDMTLKSLLAQETSAPLEIVVVDNNSSDETASIVESYEAKFPKGIRYAREGTQGLSVARNTGVQTACGDVLVFIDDDAVALPGWLQALVATYHKYPDADCVGGRVLLQLPVTRPVWFDPNGIMGTFLSQHDHGSDIRKIHYPEGIMGTNFSVRRRAFAELGLFRIDLGRVGSHLLSGEELELCRRIQRAGRSVYYCGNATVVHIVPPSRLEKRFFRRRAYWEGRTAGIDSHLLDWPTKLGPPGRESLVLFKDSIKSFLRFVEGNPRRAFEHEIAAFKRLGYLHQALLHKTTAVRSFASQRRPSGTRVARYAHSVIEAMAPEAKDGIIGARNLVLAPHPDDEVLGCGGTIARAIRDGSAMWIGFLTDGRHGVNGNIGDPVAVRKAEAIKAACTLGVSPERLFFFGCEDGRLADNVDKIIPRTQQIIDSLGINTVFVPYRGDWHPDHKAAWAIGDACRRNGTRVVEYPIWFGLWLWPHLSWKSRFAAAAQLRDVIHAVKIRVADVGDTKRRAMDAYRSQVLAFSRQPWGAMFLENFKRDHEIFFVRSATRDGRRRERFGQIISMIARAVLPFELRRHMRSRSRALMQWPPIGRVRFGGLRRITPISRGFGYARGQPIDRYYIENFLATHTHDIHGQVLEIGDRDYTQRFGGNRVIKSHVLHVVEGNPKATIVADLSNADNIPTASFDCIILTQTLHYIYDIHAAARTLHRILKPGGVILATFPGISQISRYDMDLWGECWRLTTLSARRLFEEVFPPGAVTVEAHGNVLVAVAFLHGLAVEDLQTEELNYCDQDYELNITVRAVKPEV